MCCQIERVQNPTLWQNYQIMKKQMEVKNKHTNNEKMLFHGTGDTAIDLINNRGFNRSYAGAHGNQRIFKTMEYLLYINQVKVKY